MFIPGIHRSPRMSPTADTNGGAGAADPAAAETEAETEVEGADPAAAGAEAAAATAAEDAKKRNREGFEARKAKDELEAMRKENEGYKRREEEARKAKLTEEQIVKEERDRLATQVEQLLTKDMQNKIAQEYKLPPALAARLIGTDEEAMRADAEDLAKLLPARRAGSPADPARDPSGGVPTYTRAQLRADPALAIKVAADYAAGKCKIIN